MEFIKENIKTILIIIAIIGLCVGIDIKNNSITTLEYETYEYGISTDYSFIYRLDNGKIVYNIKKGEKVEANPTYIKVTQTDYDLYEVSRWVSGICWIILGCTVYKCFEKRIINFIEGGQNK